MWEEQFDVASGDSVTLNQETQRPAPARECLWPYPWISDELFDETRRVWSKAYGRVITDEEVIEILTNVKRLTEVLLNAGHARRIS